MRFALSAVCMALGTALTLTACGESGQPPAADAQQESVADSPAPGGACALLTREEVDTVVPGNDGGTADSSMQNAIPGAKTETCRYLHVEGTNPQFLVLTVYRASTEAGFEAIDISGRLQMASPRELDIADVSFIEDMGADSIQVSVADDMDVFELTLNANDAAEKSEQLIKLARAVDERL